jgi:hypothetical protein
MEERMRVIWLAGVALALSACGGGGETAANDSNAIMADNMLMDENLMLDPNASINGTTGLDANASANATTQNLMEKDATTNDPDTNLANGL